MLAWKLEASQLYSGPSVFSAIQYIRFSGFIPQETVDVLHGLGKIVKNWDKHYNV